MPSFPGRGQDALVPSAIGPGGVVNRGIKCVLQQHGDGHRAHAAGHGRNPGGAFAGLFEFYVAAQLSVAHTGNPDVQHDRAGTDP